MTRVTVARYRRNLLRCAFALLGLTIPHRLARAQATAGAPVAVVDTGLASFYARRLNGRKTASGERLNNRSLVAAHPTLPLGTTVRVTNLANGRTIEVRIVDRGPSAARVRKGYIIDLSRAAARALGFRTKGRARVRVDLVRRPAG